MEYHHGLKPCMTTLLPLTEVLFVEQAGRGTLIVEAVAAPAAAPSAAGAAVPNGPSAAAPDMVGSCIRHGLFVQCLNMALQR